LLCPFPCLVGESRAAKNDARADERPQIFKWPVPSSPTSGRMVSILALAPLGAQSDVSQPLVILAVALGLAGLAILVLFEKGKI
jgi:hypothetical protein